MITATHRAYSDDSSQGRFHSLALLTYDRSEESRLIEELNHLLSVSAVGEFKWEKLRSAKYRFCAERLINFVFKNLDSVRIDILIWDNQDSRHAVQVRDDNENRVRMYYHLVSTVLGKRWPISGTNWEWFPDEQSSVDWGKLWDFLRSKKHIKSVPLFNLTSFARVNLEKPKPSVSAENPFIQLADLFAGMGAYSWSCHARYLLWLDFRKGIEQETLFKGKPVVFSNPEQERFRILHLFDLNSKKEKLQISLTSRGGLVSNKPNSRISFWLYQPQHEKDKAPTKK